MTATRPLSRRDPRAEAPNNVRTIAGALRAAYQSFAAEFRLDSSTSVDANLPAKLGPGEPAPGDYVICLVDESAGNVASELASIH